MTNSTAPSTALDQHGLQWREWILNNLQRNCTPRSMYERMVTNVWSHEAAILALDEGLTQLGMASQWKMPLPGIAPQAQVRTKDGHSVTVLSRLNQPRAVLLDNVLSPQECGVLIDYAMHKGLRSSGVVDGETGNSVLHQARTSTSVCFTRAETPLINAIENRLAALTQWPISHGEGLQVLRYEPGQQYKPHHDWFNPSNAGSAQHLKRGGQRVGTMVMYLAAAQEGGGTSFPKAGLEVTPKTGGAIFFNNMNVAGQLDDMSLHAGTPVVRGTKIVMTYWQREAAFR